MWAGAVTRLQAKYSYAAPKDSPQATVLGKKQQTRILLESLMIRGADKTMTACLGPTAEPNQVGIHEEIKVEAKYTSTDKEHETAGIETSTRKDFKVAAFKTKDFSCVLHAVNKVVGC